MPKPQPQMVALLKFDQEITDWAALADDVTAAEIAAWANKAIDDWDLKDDDGCLFEVVVRWSTNSAIMRAKLNDLDFPDHGEIDELRQDDPDDAVLLALEPAANEQLTKLLDARAAPGSTL